jgi:hypothetical protein
MIKINKIKNNAAEKGTLIDMHSLFYVSKYFINGRNAVRPGNRYNFGFKKVGTIYKYTESDYSKNLKISNEWIEFCAEELKNYMIKFHKNLA